MTRCSTTSRMVRKPLFLRTSTNNSKKGFRAFRDSNYISASICTSTALLYLFYTQLLLQSVLELPNLLLVVSEKAEPQQFKMNLNHLINTIKFKKKRERRHTKLLL
jgi:hypothetical protein